MLVPFFSDAPRSVAGEEEEEADKQEEEVGAEEEEPGEQEEEPGAEEAAATKGRDQLAAAQAELRPPSAVG